MRKCIYIFALLLGSTGGFCGSETYVYNKEKLGANSKTTWTIKEKDHEVYIEGTDPKSITKIVVTPNFYMQSFQSEEKESKEPTLEISLQDRNLHAVRVFNNQKQVKQYKLPNEPWIQAFDFGFRPFVKSGERKMNFLLINPKNLDLMKMIVYREEERKIKIDGKEYEGVRLKVTLRGFKGKFWKAEVWYDKKGESMILYRANEGPNTPITTITLEEEKTSIL